jgi:hypothetical protein
MKRPEAIAIMNYFAGKPILAGSTTSLYHGYNTWATFVVKEVRDTLETAWDWNIPGLFITEEEIKASPRPTIVFFYWMGCGKILSAVIPKIIIDDKVKIPNNFVVLNRGSVFKGSVGFYLHFSAWYMVGNMSDYIFKKRSSDQPFLTRLTGQIARRR